MDIWFLVSDNLGTVIIACIRIILLIRHSKGGGFFAFQILFKEISLCGTYILPAKYMKAISLIDWLFSGSDHIIATLRDADGVLEQFYKILLTKVIVWIWSAGFVISLFVCGHALQNRRTANLSAKLVGPVLSPLADTLVSMVQGNIPQNSINFMRLIEAIIDLQRMVEGLDDFGYGNQNVLSLEEEIYEDFQHIMKGVEFLRRDNSVDQEKIDTLLTDISHIKQLIWQRESLLKHR